LRKRRDFRRRRGRQEDRSARLAAFVPQRDQRAIGRASIMATQQNPSAPGSTVDPAEVAKFSKLSAEWWDPNGKMAPLHKINPLRLTYIRDAACRKFSRNAKSLNCLSGLRLLD